MLDRYGRLTLLYPYFKAKLLDGLEAVKEDGIPMQIFETYRSMDRQDTLYAKGRTSPGQKVTNARPGYSMHNYGLACDLVLWIDGKWSWDHADKYRRCGEIMKAHRLHWMGDISGDLVHFQMLPLDFDILSLKELHEDGGLEKVWLWLESKGYR